jgi:hypothetical protein
MPAGDDTPILPSGKLSVASGSSWPPPDLLEMALGIISHAVQQRPLSPVFVDSTPARRRANELGPRWLGQELWNIADAALIAVQAFYELSGDAGSSKLRLQV